MSEYSGVLYWPYPAWIVVKSVKGNVVVPLIWSVTSTVTPMTG
jgi:hypothetical protein